MKRTEGRTPAEILRLEIEQGPRTLAVSAMSMDGRPLVRIKIGEASVYHTPEDARVIAAGIVQCAEWHENK